MPENPAHDEFLELCALAASAQLDATEQRRLEEHLAVCPSCRKAFGQYRAIVDQAIPALAADEELQYPEGGGPSASLQAEKELLDRVAPERPAAASAKGRFNPVGSSGEVTQVFRFSGEDTWRRIWLLYAAGIVLCVALGITAYRAGMRQGRHVARTVPSPNDSSKELALEEQLSDASHDREVARAQLSARDQTVAELRLELRRATEALKRVASAQSAVDRRPESNGTADQENTGQRAELAQKLAEAQAKVDLLQSKLSKLDQQSAQDTARTAALESEINQLTEQLHEREVMVDQQQELLAHDRDIRELMGARDLYIAEVYDVGRSGTTEKPYGRVFYTKGKSLVFYAYDLDQQAGLRNAKSFQAWGRRGPDTQRAVNLGIFYVDNAAKKRWVLKSDDPLKLAQIDAVFVTVEPNGGSHKPSSQPLLFTYLKVEPNHP